MTQLWPLANSADENPEYEQATAALLHHQAFMNVAA